MYRMNGETISKEYSEELLSDLSMFPYDRNDYEMDISDRKKKYKNLLLDGKSVKISDSIELTLN